jgi:NAD(P)-dependent dehydrogenase (short-subunit alcohol dehydrogenase family)
MAMAAEKGVCLVVGVGDGLGSALARAFADAGHVVCMTRRARNLDALELTAQSIRDEGGTAHAFGVDARSEEEVVALFETIERDIGPLEVVVFNIGANVRFGIRETTARVFHKVWEMACFAGFLAGREAAKAMVPRGRGDPLHRRDSQRAGPRGVRSLRRRQARPAGPGPEHGARTGAARGARSPCGDRRGRRRGVHPQQP